MRSLEFIIHRSWKWWIVLTGVFSLASLCSYRLDAAEDDKIEVEAYETLLEEADRGAVEILISTYHEKNKLIAANPRLAENKTEWGRQKSRHFSGFKKELIADFDERDFEVLADYHRLPMLKVRLANSEVLSRILEHPLVRRVHKIGVSYPNGSGESLELIDQPGAAERGYRGEGRRIAVLDTGIDPHDNFFDCPGYPNVMAGHHCRVARMLECNGNQCWTNNLAQVGHGHGVSQVALAVAPEAQIISLDVYPGTGKYSPDDHQVSAVNWILESNDPDIAVINMSLGNTEAHTTECAGGYLEDGFQELIESGINPVVAAGNNGFRPGVSSPACTPNAIAVGVVHDEDESLLVFTNPDVHNCEQKDVHPDTLLCYSNYSPDNQVLDFLAPNFGALGTSFSAPVVAGALAVIRGDNLCPNCDSLGADSDGIGTSYYFLDASAKLLKLLWDESNWGFTRRVNVSDSVDYILRWHFLGTQFTPASLHVLF